MIKILLTGCNGRMGRAISDICCKDDNLEIVAGVDINTDSPFGYPVYDSISKVEEKPDVIIDFSNPGLLSSLISYATENKTPVVICTTGHSDEQINKIYELSKSLPVFRSGNMSLGINLLIMLAKKAASILGDKFDVEVIERHHNQKLDAPSGTALMIADGLSQALPYQAEYVYDRHSVRQKRAQTEIGIHSLRGGTIVGDHEVVFAGRDEIIELKHSAHSREVFATGAVKAAAFLANCDKPGMYSMDNLLADYL